MTKRIALAAILALGIFRFVSATEPTSDKKISKKDVPAAVMTAFQQAYPAAVIVGTNQETADSSTYFEIESRDGKVRRDLLYQADGSVKEIEESIAAADLPAVVKDALAKAYPNGKIRSGEKTTHDAVVEYDVTVKNGPDKLEVVLDDSGKIIKTEKITNTK